MRTEGEEVNGDATRGGETLTESEDDLVVGMFLKVGEARKVLATERTKHAMIEGTLETLGAKRLDGAGERWW